MPHAIAGATLCAARFSGKLNGLIAAIGPIGKRRVIPILPRDAGIRSSGIVPRRSCLPRHPLPEGQRRPVDLDQRVAHGLAGLERDEPAEALLRALSRR